jgi:hypothetical protein
MIIGLAAAQVDFKIFEWFSNAGADFQLKLAGHTPIRVEPDDLIGLKKTTRGPTAGSYQVVLAKYPQLVFRSIKQHEIDTFFEHLKPFAGVPDKPGFEGGRRAPIRRDVLEKSDKQSSQYFVAPNSPREQGSYDKNDYQWRQVVRTVQITTKTHGATRQSLKEHEIVGVRYLRKSHGGYVIMPSGERVMISHDKYEELTLNSDILPRARQEKGIVDLNDIARNLPKGTRIRMPRIPKTPIVKTPRKTEKGSVTDRPFHEQNKPLVSQFDYKEFDEAFDFEPEDEEELLNPPDEFEFEDDETVNTQGAPALDTEVGEEEDDPDMDHLQDVEHDEETGEPIEDEDAVYAEEGLVLKTKAGAEWIVVAVEEEGLSDNLLLYDVETKALRNYRVPAGEDLRNMKTVTPDRVMSGPKFEKIRDEAVERDLTAGKRI